MSQGGSSSHGHRKLPARKKQRTESSASNMLTFSSVVTRSRLAKLQDKPFESIRCIDWPTLNQLRIADEVCELISFGGWAQLFSIQTPAHRELTWEVLSTFTIHAPDNSPEVMNEVTFRVGGKVYEMTMGHFAVYMDIYSEEFLTTPEYSQLARDFSRGFDTRHYWSTLTNRRDYNPSKSKGSQLLSSALRYIHKLLASTLHARKETPGVVGVKDLLCLYSMRERYPIHLGYHLAEFIWEQGTRTKKAAIYAGHYITHLVTEISLFDRFPQMLIMKEIEPLDMVVLSHMRMVERRHGPQGSYYVLKGAPDDVEEAAGGAAGASWATS